MRVRGLGGKLHVRLYHVLFFLSYSCTLKVPSVLCLLITTTPPSITTQSPLSFSPSFNSLICPSHTFHIPFTMEGIMIFPHPDHRTWGGGGYATTLAGWRGKAVFYGIKTHLSLLFAPSPTVLVHSLTPSLTLSIDSFIPHGQTCFNSILIFFTYSR